MITEQQTKSGIDARNRIYWTIEDYINTYKRSPTVREISNTVKLSTSNVYHHLHVMQADGWLTITPKISRGISLKTPLEKEKMP